MKALTPDAELDLIRKKLNYRTFEPEIHHWLDTGSARLNSVLGSEKIGIPYGKMIEISGFESQGKTFLALLLASLAQADDADVAWVDTEDRIDLAWAEVRGLDPKRLYQFYPRIGEFGKEKVKRLQTAQELCSEVEAWMAMRHKQNPDGKLFLAVDSVTGFLVEDEAEAGLTGANMRTKLALATFLSSLLRRWVPLALNYNCLIVFINQMRTSPGVMFGNPNYTTGGRALKYYCSIRSEVRRVKNGKILQAGNMVGLRGIIKNVKNKSGQGSIEGSQCGFKAKFAKNDWRFLAVDKIKKDSEGEES